MQMAGQPRSRLQCSVLRAMAMDSIPECQAQRARGPGGANGGANGGADGANGAKQASSSSPATYWPIMVLRVLLTVRRAHDQRAVDGVKDRRTWP